MFSKIYHPPTKEVEVYSHNPRSSAKLYSIRIMVNRRMNLSLANRKLNTKLTSSKSILDRNTYRVFRYEVVEFQIGNEKTRTGVSA